MFGEVVSFDATGGVGFHRGLGCGTAAGVMGVTCAMRYHEFSSVHQTSNS